MNEAPVPIALGERPAVRRAAVALAKVLMREGKVKPADLQQQLTDAPVSAAPRQLVTPATPPSRPGPKPGGGLRQAQVFDALRVAGEQGLSIGAVMALTEKSFHGAYTMMWGYEKTGFVWRRRHNKVLHYVLVEVCAPIPGVALQAGAVPPHQVKQPPKPEAAKPAGAPHAAKEAAPKRQVKPRRELTAAQHGLVGYLAGNPAAKPAQQRLERNAEVIVPTNVKRTICPQVNHDPRYQVDATAFQGGEFMADWRAARGRRP